MEKREFAQLLEACAEIAEYFPDGVIYIGGIAVYLHATNLEQSRSYAEFTHDADFYISLADMADLRDIEEVTPNRRLSKHQLIKRSFEFDIYTERQASLLVPYDEIAAHSVVYEGIRVAAVEHLLVLKLEAFKDRKGSAKGEKDAKDLLRLGLIATDPERSFDVSLIAPYLSEEHMDLLRSVAKGPFAMAMAHGNAVAAKKIRLAFTQMIDTIDGWGQNTPPPPRG